MSPEYTIRAATRDDAREIAKLIAISSDGVAEIEWYEQADIEHCDMYGHIDVKEASDAVHAAIDHGITLFDTAEVYGPYHSEELLAKALGNRRKDIVLVSKVGFQYDENGKNLGRNSRYDHIIERLPN